MVPPSNVASESLCRIRGRIDHTMFCTGIFSFIMVASRQICDSIMLTNTDRFWRTGKFLFHSVSGIGILLFHQLRAFRLFFFVFFFFVPLVTAECPVCLTVFFYWSISRHRARWPPDVHRRGPSLGWELAVVEGGWRLQRRSHKLKNDLLGHRLETSVWSTVNTTVFFFFLAPTVRSGQARGGQACAPC